jgi:NADH-quinone oxidoreductase subunit E
MTNGSNPVDITIAGVGMGTSSDAAPAFGKASPPVSNAAPISDETRAAMTQVIARYPRSRSAIMPLLHLVQAEDGFVSPTGIEAVAEALELTTAEVSAVATFYSMYKRRPVGEFHVGVCTNTLCAIMGGDAIFEDLKGHLGVGNDETTPDGKVTLEHIECNAACDYAPVVMVNWEFFDDQTPESARRLVDDLRAGNEVRSTRGPKVCSFREVSRTLAGFEDGLVGEGPAAGPASLVGLEIAKERGDEAPSASAVTTGDAESAPAASTAQESARPSSSDAPAETAASDPANPASEDGSAREKED